MLIELLFCKKSYFMVVPSMAGFGNYMAPVLVGAPDMFVRFIFIRKLIQNQLTPAGIFEGKPSK